MIKIIKIKTKVFELAKYSKSALLIRILRIGTFCIQEWVAQFYNKRMSVTLPFTYRLSCELI